MPTFTPTLPSDGTEEGAATDRPYTSLMMASIRLGFSYSELRTMRYPMLLLLVDEISKGGSTKGKGKEDRQEVREATQADVNWLLGM